MPPVKSHLTFPSCQHFWCTGAYLHNFKAGPPPHALSGVQDQGCLGPPLPGTADHSVCVPLHSQLGICYAVLYFTICCKHTGTKTVDKRHECESLQSVLEKLQEQQLDLLCAEFVCVIAKMAPEYSGNQECWHYSVYLKVADFELNPVCIFKIFDRHSKFWIFACTWLAMLFTLGTKVCKTWSLWFGFDN